MSLDRPSAASLVALTGGDGPAPTLGRVRLVGAGPGDPELLTLRAARALAQADVIVHDRLIPDAVLAYARLSARRIYVGKRKSHHSVPQDGINALLVGLAREGLDVVRLKAGDPFVFGRGGEELAACLAEGVPCEVVPGVTAALAAGVPLTYRGMAQAVTFVTGHAAGEGGEPALDWTALANPNQTVVVYMGLSTATVIATRLMSAGRAGSTPVLVVENVSRPEERRVQTTLAGLSATAATLDGPAVLVIGEVAALAASADEPANRSASSSGSCRGSITERSPDSERQTRPWSTVGPRRRGPVDPRDEPEDDATELARAAS